MPLKDNSNAESAYRERVLRTQPEYFSFAELAQRWRCSRATVYNRLRGVGAEVLDFASPGKKGKKVIAVDAVFQIEERRMKRLR